MTRLALAVFLLSAGFAADDKGESCLDKGSGLVFVDIQEEIPSILVELPYATPNNFTKQQVYPTGSRAKIRSSVACSLKKAQEELQRRGLSLKIWDAYRPFSIQEKLWKAYPNSDYVRKPVRRGKTLVEGSFHNRGGALDLTLVDKNGKELEMPTPYDEFSKRAHRDYKGGTSESLKNRVILEDVMHKHGFQGLRTEWWHFDWKGSGKFPLSDHDI